MNAPVILGPNQPERFYRGGAGIARLRGIPQVSQYVPEDFVGSVTELFGQSGAGLTRLEGGQTLIVHLGMSGRMTLHDAKSASEHPFGRHDHVSLSNPSFSAIRGVSGGLFRVLPVSRPAVAMGFVPTICADNPARARA